MHTKKENPTVSIIVPTYKEAGNITYLVGRIENIIQQYKFKTELIIVDDDSRDGIQRIVAELNKSWINLIVRKKQKDLSRAVLEGINCAKGQICVIMDADLSHPPEAIPQMVKRLKEGCDFVIGSRYVKGGSTDIKRGLFRFLNSYFATLLARPFTKAKDPMSGFFCFWRRQIQKANQLDPVGYKIGLELLVKCRCKRICELPIHFTKRKFGKSKLNLNIQLQYLKHIYKLLVYKYKYG